MTTLQFHTLPYQPDSLLVMDKFVDLPWPILLDSGFTSNAENYSGHTLDIISANPAIKVISNGKTTRLKTEHSQYTDLNEDVFSALRSRLTLTESQNHGDNPLFPAAPGWIGSLSYDLSKQLESLPLTSENDLSIPDAAFGFYNWVIATDHRKKITNIIYLDNTDIADVLSRFAPPTTATDVSNEFGLISDFHSDQSPESYKQRFDSIKDFINAGDAYQINFAQRFSAQYEGSSWEAYKVLRANNPAPMGAYFSADDFHLLSLSPERFISVVDQQLLTTPIKGTRPRTNNKATDELSIKELKASTKDQAENLMIVDLLRNDFGKVCVPGSISVPKLFDIESYPNVHHLVSTIKGTLDHNQDAIEAVKQCFPGGSITGAPKIRAMEIIEELEIHSRTAYCGSIAYFNVLGASDSNINIRTLVMQNGAIHCWAGGGIVADSVCEDEYQETFDKVGRYLQTLEELKR